jgi:NTP pyrophosphatase (non-canonical NTP hydrolase)
MKIDERIFKIADHYGVNSQLDILQEECAELIQAVSKYRRTNDPNVFDRMHLEEEIADVEIMIAQIKYLMKLSEKDIRGIKDTKLERQLERMKDDTQN